jgi:hypothetical protein
MKNIPNRFVSLARTMLAAALFLAFWGQPAVGAEPTAVLAPRFVAVSAGLPEGLKASYVHWLDYNGDGRPDLLVNGGRLFRNDSTPGECKFVEVTGEAGLSGGGAALCYDVDNDGLTDIVTVKGKVWRNLGEGRFADVASELGYAPHVKAMTLAAGDLDHDGFADLFIGMSEDWNNGKSPAYYPAQLWRNEGGKRWVEQGGEAGLSRKSYARSVLIHDVDGDGKQDVFVANYRLQANLLWMNQGGLRFREEAKKRGVAGNKDPKRHFSKIHNRHYGPSHGHCIGSCWLDFDNDGVLDLFVANLVHKYVGPSGGKGMSYDIRGYVCDDSAIYRNDGQGVFEDWRERLGVALKPIGGRGVYAGDELWSGAAAGDANNDGWADVFVPQVYNLPYAKALLFLNQAGKKFANVASAAGIERIDTYAGVWADIDGDGWLDLATAGRPKKDAPAALCLYHNQGLKGDRRFGWLKVSVAAAPGQGTPLGTLVRVTVPGLTQTQVYAAGTSTYGQQNDPVLHFGLGEVAPETEVTVTVRWPDGREITLPPARPGQTVKAMR